VENVNFLAQIRLEIQLHWDFRFLPIDDVIDSLNGYKTHPENRWSNQFLNELSDLNEAVKKVHDQMLWFRHAFSEHENQQPRKYLTSILDLAQMINPPRRDIITNGGFLYFVT
jgi:hypothetical protein